MSGHNYATWDSPTEQAILKTLVEKDGGDWNKVELKAYKADAKTCKGLLYKPGDSQIERVER